MRRALLTLYTLVVINLRNKQNPLHRRCHYKNKPQQKPPITEKKIKTLIFMSKNKTPLLQKKQKHSFYEQKTKKHQSCYVIGYNVFFQEYAKANGQVDAPHIPNLEVNSSI